MSETAPEATTTTETATVETTETKPAEVDWKAKSREWEKRAKENSAAAQKLAELEESQKTEAQKLADAKAAAEAERDTARAEALRFRIAAKFQISDEDADLFLTGTDEETLTRQAERLAARTEAAATTAPGPRPDSTQGATTGAGALALNGDPLLAAVKGKLGIR